MRITDLLKKEGIDLQGKSASKSETIDNLVELMDATGNLNDKEGYKKAVVAREEQGTTGIGEGIAIPHGKTSAVKEAGLAVMVSKAPTMNPWTGSLPICSLPLLCRIILTIHILSC